MGKRKPGNGEGGRVGVPGPYQSGLSKGVSVAATVLGALNALSSDDSYRGGLYYRYPRVGLPLRLVLLTTMHSCFAGPNVFRNASFDEDTPMKVCGPSLGKDGREIRN